MKQNRWDLMPLSIQVGHRLFVRALESEDGASKGERAVPKRLRSKRRWEIEVVDYLPCIQRAWSVWRVRFIDVEMAALMHDRSNDGALMPFRSIYEGALASCCIG